MAIIGKKITGNIIGISGNGGYTNTTISHNSGWCGTINTTYNDNIIEMVEYIDYINQILGVNLDFNKFKSMTDAERIKFLRNEKIGKIL